MNLLGVHLTLLIGPTIPVPASPDLMESLKSVEVTHSDEARSGFRITFQVGRSGVFEIDYPLLSNPLLRPFNRVIILVSFNLIPKVLMDGIITNQRLSPGSQPGASTLTVTGDDVSVMLDMKDKSAEHPAQDEIIVANKIILSYAQYQIIPMVIPPPTLDPPLPIERIPVQQCSDLEHLKRMAGRYGYVFYISPGPVPFTNTGYFGPPKRLDIPQSALSVNMGPESNVDTISFNYNGLEATEVSGKVQDRMTNSSMPVQNILTTRPPLSSQPALLAQSHVRSKQFRAEGGLSFMQAMAQAQGITDSSMDTITAQGDLDAMKYGGILQARGVVGLRGAGYSYDGLYYVKSVTHTISRGSYKQKFTLKRDGLGSITPVVIP